MKPIRSSVEMRPRVPEHGRIAACLLDALPAAAQQRLSTRPEVDRSQGITITANTCTAKQREVAGRVAPLDGRDPKRRCAREHEVSLTPTPGLQFNTRGVASNTINIRGIGTSPTIEGSGARQGPTGHYLGPKSDQVIDSVFLPGAHRSSTANPQRVARFLAETSERCRAAPTNSRRSFAPTGSGHAFVHEQPVWTVGVMRKATCGRS